MTRCPSCDHDAHESYCPNCGCEDYMGPAKPLTGQELAARQSQVSPPEVAIASQKPTELEPDTCRECGHHVNRHWWVADETGGLVLVLERNHLDHEWEYHLGQGGLGDDMWMCSHCHCWSEESKLPQLPCPVRLGLALDGPTGPIVSDGMKNSQSQGIN